MNTSIQHPKPNDTVQPSGDPSKTRSESFGEHKLARPFGLMVLLAGLLFLLFGAPSARADQSPPGCAGSGLGVVLYVDVPDAHIGDTIHYSVLVFNGPPGSPLIACDATSISASLTTPDGVTHPITLLRTSLSNGQSDYYANAATYVVRTQDIQPDGTVRATARDTGSIHQNDTDSQGGANQGVNTEISRPCTRITGQCVGSIGENGGISFSGMVTNCGNNILNNVTVTNYVNGQAILVFGPVSLGTNQGASFSGSYVSANPCGASTAILSARGVDDLTASPQTVISTANVTCSQILTPGIKVTKACPLQPVSAGQLLTFSGSVSNTGNVTLTNIVVVNSQPAANTSVFTHPALAPGEVVSFTGSYIAPTSCSVADTLTATATSRCGAGVSSVASATCPILTTPQIAVTVLCPANPAAPGGTLTYSGTVRNVGDTTLNNIVVVSDRPAPNTSVFTLATLAPGASANFTSSLTVPAGACSVTTTFSGRGKDICNTTTVTNTVSATCPISSAPAIAVTLACPTVAAPTGGSITYTGTVRNSGKVTLNNVTVVNNQAVPSTVFTVASLAPGVSANFTASFTAPADSCSISTTVIASGSDACTANSISNTASATCALATTPSIAVTQECPTTPISPGGIATYTSHVRNAGNITLSNVVVTSSGSVIVPSNTVTTFWVDDALPAGAVPATDGGDVWNFVSNNPAPFSGSKAHQSTISAGMHQHYFTSANPAFAIKAGDILVAYVYIDPANVPSEVMLQWNDGGSWDHRAYWGVNLISFGTDGTASRRFMGALPAAGQWVRLEVPASVVGLEGRSINAMAFTLFDGRATWDAAGKVTQIIPPPGGTTVFTAATLAPGDIADFTVNYTVPAGSGCSFSSTLTASAANTCTGTRVTANVSTTCPMVTAPRITVTQTCPVNLVSPGGILSYSGIVSNAGNITLTNVVVVNDQPASNTVVFTVATLAPGAKANFTGSYRVPLNCCVVSSTLGATGKDLCTGATVADTFTATCTVLTVPRIVVTKVCPPTAVRTGETLQYSGIVSNAGNITLVNVTIVNTQPTAGSPVWGPITLAPGEAVTYYASYVVSPDFCGLDTVTAQGLDACNFASVVSSVTKNCPIITTTRIAVTKNCPSQTALRGGVFTFTGTVSNPGSVTLTNVIVVNNYQVDCFSRTNGPVIGPITLAPGASVDFSGSYTAPRSCCQITDTLTASGQDRCASTRVSATATAICPLQSTPGITVTKICSNTSVPVGEVFTYSGSVSNSGDVGLTNVTVVSSQPSANTKVLGPLELAPGETKLFSGSYTVTANSNPATDTVTAQGTDSCLGRTVASRADCSGPLVSLAISSVTVANNIATVSWSALPGDKYRLQSASDSKGAEWTDISGDVTTTGDTASKDDAIGTNAHRLYRVKIVP